MVLGIATYTWDVQKGPVLEYMHPESLSISDSALTKLFMAQSIDENSIGDFDFAETTVGDRTYWSYCDLTRRQQGGREICLLLLDPSERSSPLKYKTRFLNFARLYFKHAAKEREAFFQSSIGLFFEPQVNKKVLLVGRAASGKTSIKHVVFEGKDPYNLLFNPVEPTRDLEPSLHSWLDLNVSLFDSSGQEFDRLIDDVSLQNIAFGGTFLVIHVIDIIRWMENKELVLSDIKKMHSLVISKENPAQQVLFINKIDLVNDLQRQKVFEDISSEIQQLSGIDVYPTSIHPSTLFTIHDAFTRLLGKASQNSKMLQDVLAAANQSEKKVGIFIANQEGAIIAQVTSKDFEHVMINCTHEIIGQINQILDHVHEGDGIVTASITSRSGVRISAWFLDLVEFDMATLIISSTGMLDAKITALLEKIKQELWKRLYHG